MKHPKAILLFSLFSLFLALTGYAQNLKEMALIPGGTFIMGEGYNYEIKGAFMHYLGEDLTFTQLNQNGVAIGEVPMPNVTSRQVTVSSFYLSEREVSNLDYRTFLIDSLLTTQEAIAYYKAEKKAAKDPETFALLWRNLVDRALATALYPDTACWTNDFVFAYNDPLSKNYFSHPAFDDYPVVGVTWAQAKAYCAWASRVVNLERERKGKPALPNFRLPTEAEFEYAALGRLPNADNKPVSGVYPWEGTRVWDEKGKFLANIKTDQGNYIDDNYEYTAPVKSFPPNAWGLHDMAGNVAEWVEDVFRVEHPYNEAGNELFRYQERVPESGYRVAKGGSWAEYKYGAMCGSRTGMDPDKGHSRVGFRLAMTIP